MTKTICALLITLTTLPASIGQEKTPSIQSISEEQILTLEKEFVAACSKSLKAMGEHYERVLAADAVVILDDGSVLTKDEILKFAKNGNRKPVEVEQKDLKTRVLGDTVVVTGRSVMKEAGYEDTRFTHVYAKQGDKWQIVSAQYTNVKR